MRFGGLIAAIVFAAIAAIIVLKMSAGRESAKSELQPGQQAQVATTNIYVAATEIPVGTKIEESMVSIQPWPQHLVLEGFMKAEEGASVVGMVARAPFQAQEPILANKLSNANDPNFLAGTLPKGMRVITIRVNEIEGLAGFVFPGDFVDVLLTRDVQKWETTPPAVAGAMGRVREQTDTITETLLTNVKVLAVDQRASNANATDKDGKLLIPRSVSLMVSPVDAQRLRLGQQKGTLTLALRSLADRESADPLTLTGTGDISQYEEGTGVGPTDGGVSVIRGTDSEIIRGATPMMPAPTTMQNISPTPQTGMTP